MDIAHDTQQIVTGQTIAQLFAVVAGNGEIG
jgi:hypothetical protein